MAITDFLVGKSGLKSQRDKAIEFAEERYDPSVYAPQVDLYRERATEGLNQRLEQTARQRTIESLFRKQDLSLYGGSQARAIAGSQQQTQQAQRGMAGFERQLTEADIQAQQAGERGFAEARTQQRQTQAQQDAAIKEAELQYETELQRRKQQLGAALGKTAGMIAGVAGAGPLASAAIGGGAGLLGGGGGGAATGAVSGLTTAMQMDMMNPEEEEGQYPEGSLAGTPKSIAGIGAKGMDADVPENQAMNLPSAQDVSGFEPLPTPTETPAPRTEGGGQPLDGGIFGDLPELPSLEGEIGTFQGFEMPAEMSDRDKYVQGELEAMRGDGFGRWMTDRFMGGMFGYDTRGNDYTYSVADILSSPFTEGIPLIQERLKTVEEQAQERRKAFNQ